jgi:hypothetical protein
MDRTSWQLSQMSARIVCVAGPLEGGVFPLPKAIRGWARGVEHSLPGAGPRCFEAPLCNRGTRRTIQTPRFE